MSLVGEADEVHGVLNELCRRIDDESSRNGLLTGDQDADEATVQVLIPPGHHSTSTVHSDLHQRGPSCSIIMSSLCLQIRIILLVNA